MTRPAVFVIDMLNDCFGHAGLQRLRPSLCASINTLTAAARAAGHPVVWVRQEFAPDLGDAMLDMKRGDIRMFIKGTPGPMILDELERDASDLEVVKKRFSMFFGTDLDAVLARLGTDQVVLAGVNSHACIRMAAIDAYQRDLDVLIVRECVASRDVRHHEVTMDYLDGGVARVVGLDDAVALLGERSRMRYVTFVAGPWEPPGLPGRVLQSALHLIVPKANPDFERAYERVTSWWLEIDEAGQVQREIGFDAALRPLAIAPFRGNFGIFTDLEGHPGPLGAAQESSAFEAAWREVASRFPPE